MIEPFREVLPGEKFDVKQRYCSMCGEKFCSMRINHDIRKK